MVTVPTQNQPTVKAQALPSARYSTSAPIGAFGGHQADSLMKGAAGLEKARKNFEYVALKEDEARVKDLDRQFNEQLRNIQYGDNGYYNQRGVNAVNSYQNTNKQIDDLYNKMSNGLTPRVLDMFKDVTQRRVESARRSMMVHRERESRVWQNATSAARIEDALEDAIVNAGNEEALRHSLGTIEAELIDRGEREGIGGVALREQLENYRSKAHAGVIGKLQTYNAPLAQQHYERFKQQIEPSEQIKIEKSLKAHADKQYAANKADEIIQDGGDIGDMLTKAKSIKDAYRREDIVSLIKGHWKDQELIESSREEAKVEETWRIIENNREAGISIKDQLNIIPADLPHDTKEKMRKFINNGGEQTNWDEYEYLTSLKPDELAKVNLNEYELADTERKQLIKLKNSAAEGKTTFTDIQGYANAFLDQHNIKKERRGAFKAQLFLRQEEFERREGRPMTLQEQKREMLTLMLPTRFDPQGLLNQEKGKLFEVLDKVDTAELNNGATYEVANVPEKYVQQIVDALAKKGVSITAANIERTYLTAKQQGLIRE